MKRNKKTNFLITIIALSATLILIELGCFFINQSLPTYESRWVFRQNKPPAYFNSPYFSTDFIIESSRSVHLIVDEKSIILRDFKGKYINVVNGHRKTSFTPETPTNSVHMYGASTLFCQEVPDDYTISSKIQRKINEITKRYKVINYGLPEMNSEQQLNLLYKTKLKNGDIVIFYDGGSDILHNVYSGYDPGVNVAYQNSLKQPDFFQSTILPTLESVKLTNLSKLLKYIRDKSIPYNMRIADTINTRALKASEIFSKNIQLAYEYTNKSGAYFYHFYIPNIFSLKNRTQHQQYLIDNFLLTPPGLERAFNYQEIFIRHSDALNTKGISSINLSKAFENRSNEVFLDFAHVTEEANEIVAQSIYSNIKWIP
jgi:hypothetical protein